MWHHPCQQLSFTTEVPFSTQLLEEYVRPRNTAILVLLLTTIASYAVSEETVADVVKQTSDAVVLIVVSDSAGQENTLGSGFLVSADGEIVTNYHVIKDAHSAI